MALDQELLEAALPRYEIGEEIGRGGWGIVLRGRHRDLGREVAIKQLPRAFGADPQVRERFIAEARLVASLDHPHIVPVFDFVEHEGLCVIVMELAGGGTLWDRFRDEGLETDQAVGVVLAVAVGLHHAHQAGVLHRDVKPENVLFSGSGTPKIADFGIAKSLGSEAAARTATGSVIGTPAYMAPEQVTGDELSPATDVYSLAVVLYELLSGELPYRPVTEPVAQLFQHVNDEPRPLAEVRPGVPEPLARVVLRALSKSPADRPASAEELAVELATAATAALGPGWLARSGMPVMSATSVVAATERAAPEDGGARRAGTVLVRPLQEHRRLGDMATPPPSPTPPPTPAPPTVAPSPPTSAATTPPPPRSADPHSQPQTEASSSAARPSRTGWLLGAAAAVVAVAVTAVLLLGGGSDGSDQDEAASPASVAAVELTAAEVAAFETACERNGVSDARCECAVDRSRDQLTAEEFRANLELMRTEGGLTDTVAAIFEDCIDDGF